MFFPPAKFLISVDCSSYLTFHSNQPQYYELTGEVNSIHDLFVMHHPAKPSIY